MDHFFDVDDIGSLELALARAQMIKAHPRKGFIEGQGKSIGLLFFNPSLRTRLSSQRAAQNLGLDAVVLDVGSESWELEFSDGTIMNGASAEHIKEAAAVMGAYFDFLAIRAFASLEDRDLDYAEPILTAFMKYAGVPIINMESSTGHPLQAFADLITINELKKTERPKVVLSWAPHPRPLPHAVANSFAQWMNRASVDLVITHPEGYELDSKFVGSARVETNQSLAFEGADFVYAKNWSSYQQYGQVLHQDAAWMIDQQKMNQTNDAYFMHCLPVRRNVIVGDEVIDSPKSIVVEQAVNRIISMQTVLCMLLEQKYTKS
jgi:N-succinyl-L-ornithine transcarbamylase